MPGSEGGISGKIDDVVGMFPEVKKVTVEIHLSIRRKNVPTYLRDVPVKEIIVYTLEMLQRNIRSVVYMIEQDISDIEGTYKKDEWIQHKEQNDGSITEGSEQCLETFGIMLITLNHKRLAERVIKVLGRIPFIDMDAYSVNGSENDDALYICN